MKSTIFSSILAFAVAVCSNCHAEEPSDAELLEAASHVVKTIKESHGKSNSLQTIDEGMGHLADAQKIRAIMLFQFDEDLKNGRGRPDVGGFARFITMNDPNFIRDPTEMRKMLAEETDARRFLLLLTLESPLVSNHKADFVAAEAHMLFCSDPMSALNWPGEYNPPRLWNASHMTYDSIIHNLKVLRSDFVPPETNLPYDERIPILVDWLKTNWPGCEHLGERGALMPRSGTESQKPQTPAERSAKQFPVKVDDEAPAKPAASKSWLLVITIGIILLAVFFVWKNGKSKASGGTPDSR